MSSDQAQHISRTWAVIPAAGMGTRMGSQIPKQYLPLAGRPVLAHTVERLLSISDIHGVVIAHAADDCHWSSLSCARDSRVTGAVGGETRALSVLNALQQLPGDASENDWVLVHDAARPCITAESVLSLMSEVKGNDVGAILATPINDTIKKSDSSQSITATLARENLWAAQTPQIFRIGLLRDCLRAAFVAGDIVTDESSAVELAGFTPKIVLGRTDNIKITQPGDLAMAESILQQQARFKEESQ